MEPISRQLYREIGFKKWNYFYVCCLQIIKFHDQCPSSTKAEVLSRVSKRNQGWTDEILGQDSWQIYLGIPRQFAEIENWENLIGTNVWIFILNGKIG